MQEFKNSESRKSNSSTLQLINSLTIFTDGASSGNPGPASIGVCILDEKGGMVLEVSETVGYATNNVAEYLACITGLIEAVKLGNRQQKECGSSGVQELNSNSPTLQLINSVTLCCDSELVIRQLQGVYSVKSKDLFPLYMVAKKLLSLFENIKLKAIPREQNTKADALAGKALKQERSSQAEAPKKLEMKVREEKIQGVLL